MTKSRIKLLLLAALFLAPLLAAVALYFWFPETIPGGRLNHGTLVEPVQALPALQLADAAGARQTEAVLQGKWTLVYLGADTCDDACQQRLLLTRQVRLALAEKRTRVQRVYLAPDTAAAVAAAEQLKTDHPDLLVLADGAGRARAFFRPADPHDVFLVDPLGNWLMAYRGAVTHKGLHRDLKKLLRFSQIG